MKKTKIKNTLTWEQASKIAQELSLGTKRYKPPRKPLFKKTTENESFPGWKKFLGKE